jgi:hypothetical protein
MPTSSTTYSNFVDNIRAWANKDSDVLSDAVIQDAMSYAADTAYKLLKVPALEATATYTVIADDDVAANNSEVYIDSSSDNQKFVRLRIPNDLTSFIHLRIKDSNNASKKGVVFNEKTDVRTFFDMYADRYSGFYWSRQVGSILAAVDITVGDEFELFYYRRLPALDALDDENNELNHWLRDENRKVLLFGALYQCFDYLADDVQSAKYKQKFMESIQELNQEEKERKSSGGNIQMHFNSQLI